MHCPCHDPEFWTKYYQFLYILWCDISCVGLRNNHENKKPPEIYTSGYEKV